MLAFIRHKSCLYKTFLSTFNGSNIGFISEVQLTIIDHLLYVYFTSLFKLLINGYKVSNSGEDAERTPTPNFVKDTIRRDGDYN